MNQESRNFQENREISIALKRYEEMLRKGNHIYFDVFQLEHIIDNFLEEGKIYPALQAVEMGMNQHPASIPLKIKKASILLNMGEISNSLKLTNELVQIEDSNHELYLLKGSSHLLLGESEEARKSFNLSLKHSIEDRDETLFNIGYAYEQNENYDKAIEFLTEAIVLDPKNDEALYELAYCYEKINENEKSIECYDKYLDLEPFSDSAWFNMGILYTKIEDYDKSVWAYEFALAINEEFPNAWFNIGHSYMLKADYLKAIESFNSYCQFDADNDEILCLIADCFLNLKEYKKALKHYNKALTNNPLNDKAHFNIGIIKKIENKLYDSMKHLQKAVNIDEENSNYHFALANVASKLNNLKVACDAFDAACELTPLEINYWLTYSEMLFKQGMVVKAIEILNLSLEFHPNNSLIEYRLAAYLIESNNEFEALGFLRSALESDFENHSYLYDSYPEAKNHTSVLNLIKKYSSIDS